MRKVLTGLLVVLIVLGWFISSSAQHERGITSLGIFYSVQKIIGGNRDDSTISPWFGRC